MQSLPIQLYTTHSLVHLYKSGNRLKKWKQHYSSIKALKFPNTKPEVNDLEEKKESPKRTYQCGTH